MYVTLRAYGRTLGVDMPQEVLEPALQRLPPTYRRAAGRPDRSWRLHDGGGRWVGAVDGEAVAHAGDPVVAAELLLSDLELWVAEHARGRVFVHAGCVAWRGRAIVLPGRTMSGKSSLTAALVRAGAIYYSDEYAVLDSAGLVRPYARPLSIRPYDGGPAKRVPVSDYGGRAGRSPVPTGLVAHLRFDCEGDTAEEVSRGVSVLHLVDNCVAARTRPRAVMSAVVSAVGGAITLGGARGDADEAAQELLARANW